MITRETLQETRRQGTLLFPCTMYFAEDTSQAEPFEVKTHWHGSVEILHLAEGFFQLGIDMEQFSVTEEAFVFVESGRLHTLFSAGGYREQAILFDPALPGGEDSASREIVEPLMQGRTHFPLILEKKDPGFAEVKKLYEDIAAIFLSDGIEHDDQRHLLVSTSQLKVKAALIGMIAVLEENNLITGMAAAADVRVETLKEVITFIRDHYDEKIYLASLARIMNMNEQYFCRFFRRITGRTPFTYINEVRIRHACELLRGTDLPVLEIAGNCGYGNVGHFIEEFKKLTGTKPSAYRRK